MAKENISRQERTNALFSVISNMITILTASVVGFFLPKFVSVDTYAGYRTFMLYAGYLGFFHLGFINGIYLKYGGFNYDELPQEKFRKYTRFLALFQLLIQLLLLTVLFCITGSDIVSPILFVILYLVVCNLNTHFIFINQFTKRFRLDAIVQLVQNAVTLTGLGLLIIFRDENYIHYITVMFAAYITVLVILLWKDKELAFGKAERILENFGDISDKIKHGFFIMISEFMGIFVVTFDSLIVNIFLSVNDFAMYAFAVSVVTFMFQLTAVISKLIFPYLKRVEESSLPSLYEKMKTYMILFSSAVGGMALVIVLLIPLILPNYNDSGAIIAILGISVIFKGVQEMVCGNFFKVLNIEKDYAKVNVFALVLSVISDIAAFAVFHTPVSVAVASVVTFVMWLLVSDTILRKKMNVSKSWGYLLMITIALLYYFCISIDPLVGFVLYYLVVAVIAAVVWKKYPLFKKAPPASLD